MTGARFLLFALLSCSILLARADEEAPSSAKQQIESLQKIETLQRRADKLVFGGPGADNYYLAKARTWLDLALGEYHENEGNGIVPASIEQAETLLDALEKKQAISMDTPQQITGSEAVRPDLWIKIAELKQHQKFVCGQRTTAEAEVHLLWAGHEKLESSWADAQSYARTAEDLLNQAQTSIDDCEAELRVVDRITLYSYALFGFSAAKLEPSAKARLDRLADSIREIKALEEVVLVGHTDRLRSDGHPERNQLLSERRAESIKQYLIGKGIPADRIHASGAGSSEPIVKCSTEQSKKQQIECLQPNRRVEITLRGMN